MRDTKTLRLASPDSFVLDARVTSWAKRMSDSDDGLALSLPTNLLKTEPKPRPSLWPLASPKRRRLELDHPFAVPQIQTHALTPGLCPRHPFAVDSQEELLANDEQEQECATTQNDVIPIPDSLEPGMELSVEMQAQTVPLHIEYLVSLPLLVNALEKRGLRLVETELFTFKDPHKLYHLQPMEARLFQCSRWAIFERMNDH